MYILTIILFSGQIMTHEFNNAGACNNALYQELDSLFIKNIDRKSTRLNSSHSQQSRMPSSA